MSEVERNIILKAALVLVLLEGWTTSAIVRARLGVDVAPALVWLGQNGYIQAGGDLDGGSMSIRWRPQHTFEALWDRLMPHRPCPLTLCGKAIRGSRVRGLQK